MSPIAVSIIAFVIILAGATIGALLRNALPGHHLADDAKDVFRLGAGLVGTIAALVLSLLIASAKSSYDTQSTQVQHLTAHLVLLDRLLAQYGAEARPARDLMRRSVAPLVDRIWRENSSTSAKEAPFEATAVAEEANAKIEQLSPQTETERSIKARAVQLATDITQTRLLLFEQADKSIPMPFLAVLIFWLAVIFMSFSLFARPNPTIVAGLVLFALSASAAIFLILEMSQAFSGLVQISSGPLRNALAPLGNM
jgi:hypothetical protein